MTNIEQAIKEAMEKGGYKPSGLKTWIYSDALLDPSFWQAFAKARKEIDANWPNGEMRCENKLGRCDSRYCEYAGYRNPYERWHLFIDHLAEGKDAENFFAELPK
jgi:hypothetical protein